MNIPLFGVAISFFICGAVDYGKSGWVPLQRPAKITAGSLAVWLIERMYLLYAATAAATLVAAVIFPRG